MTVVFDAPTRQPAPPGDRPYLGEPDSLVPIAAALGRWVVVVGFAVACASWLILIVVIASA